jgi:hypothetical protein
VRRSILEGRDCFIVRARAVTDNLPSKKGAHLPKGLRLAVAKGDKIFRVKGDDEIITVALECHQPFRTI